MPRGKSKALEEAEGKASKFQKTLDDGAEEFVCPITQELPIDPVLAEDGRVYERSAITAWLRTNNTSPHTREAMGSKLIPVMQVKNLISSMVKSGAISGEKATAWTKKLEDEGEVEEARRKAEAGDTFEITRMGRMYRYGKHGMPKDPSTAIEWFKRAADLEYPPAIGYLGLQYLDQYPVRAGAGGFAPVSVTNGRAEGLMLVTQAATMGGEHACYSLAKLYSTGRGVTQDFKRAQYWAKKAIDKDHVKYDQVFMKDWARETCARWAAGDFAPVAAPAAAAEA
jgi:hypothetical protein